MEEAFPGYTGFQQGLWVADDVLFWATYSRRLLFGIAAYLEQPLMLVPTLASDRGLPVALTHSLVSEKRRKEVDLIMRVMDSVQPWLQDELQKETLLKAASLPTDYTLIESIAPLHQCFTGDRSWWQFPYDVDTVVESLVCGAEFIATNNLKNVRHADLNTWARETLGVNRDIIGDSTSLARRYLSNDRETLLVIAAMSVATHPRDLYLEEDSVRSFLNGLLDSDCWIKTYHECEPLFGHIVEIEEVLDLMNKARDLTRKPAFIKARGAEDALQTIRAECLLTESERGTIAPLTEDEQGLIEKYAI